MWKVMCMDLWFVCAGAHHPFAIFADPDAGAGFFEFEVLEQLDSVCILGVVLQAALPFPRKPVGQRPGRRRTRNGVDGHVVRVCELHGGG